MLYEGIYARLLADAGVVAILGAKASRADKKTGIFPVLADKAATLPMIVYLQIAGQPEADSLDGSNAFQSARVQISCFAEGYSPAKRLARAAKLALVGFRGTLSDGTEVDSIRAALELDAWEDGPATYHCPLDVTILFRDVSP